MTKKQALTKIPFHIKGADGLFFIDESVMELRKKVGQYWDFYADIKEIMSYGFEANTSFLGRPILVVIFFKNCKIPRQNYD